MNTHYSHMRSRFSSNGWMNGWANEQINEMYEWMNKWMNTWMDESDQNGLYWIGLNVVAAAQTPFYELHFHPWVSVRECEWVKLYQANVHVHSLYSWIVWIHTHSHSHNRAHTRTHLLTDRKYRLLPTGYNILLLLWCLMILWPNEWMYEWTWTNAVWSERLKNWNQGIDVCKWMHTIILLCLHVELIFSDTTR